MMSRFKFKIIRFLSYFIIYIIAAVFTISLILFDIAFKKEKHPEQ